MLDTRRWCAFAATVTAVLGSAGLAIAVAGSEPFRYVSESGVDGAPHPTLYRVSMLLLAVSLALLALPARHTGHTRFFPGWLAAGSLLLAAPLATVSAAVTCSPGCPLPPYETPATRDLVHAAGAIGALLLIALVMLVYATQPDPTTLRRTGRLAVLFAYPPLLLSAAGIAFLGRGLFSGVLERISLVTVSAWLVATATVHLRTKP